VRQLCVVLEGLRLLLRRLGEVESELLSRRRHDCLLALLVPGVAAEVAALALGCAQALGASAKCVDAISAVPSVWAPNTCLLLHERPRLALGALRLLRVLAANHEAVGALLAHGAHLLALRLLVATFRGGRESAEIGRIGMAEGGVLKKRAGEWEPASLSLAEREAASLSLAEQEAATLSLAERRRLREAACALIGRMAADAAHGEGVLSALSRLLPAVLIETMQEGAAKADATPSAAALALAGGGGGGEGADAMAPQSAGLRLFDETQENPELVWDNQMRAELAACLDSLCRELASHLRSSKNIPPPSLTRGVPPLQYTQLGSDLNLGGVWVARFVRQPQWALRKPGRFLDGLLKEWALLVPAAAAAALAEQQFLSQPACDASSVWGSVCNALVALLGANPALAREVAARGAAPQFTAHCAHVDSRVARVACAVSLTLAGSQPGLQALRRFDSVAQLTSAVASRCERAALVLGALTKMAALPDLVGQAMRCGLPGLCLRLVEGGSNTYDEPPAVRAHAVQLLRALAADATHGAEVTSLLETSAAWSELRAQAVDLFLKSDHSGLSLLEHAGRRASGVGLLALSATNAAALSRPPPAGASSSSFSSVAHSSTLVGKAKPQPPTFYQLHPPALPPQPQPPVLPPQPQPSTLPPQQQPQPPLLPPQPQSQPPRVPPQPQPSTLPPQRKPSTLPPQQQPQPPLLPPQPQSQPPRVPPQPQPSTLPPQRKPSTLPPQQQPQPPLLPQPPTSPQQQPPPPAQPP